MTVKHADHYLGAEVQSPYVIERHIIKQMFSKSLCPGYMGENLNVSIVLHV